MMKSVRKQIPSKLVFDPLRKRAPIDWKRLFGREGPVEVEVGTGKGRFLLTRASQYPDRCFVGLEYARAYLVTAAERAEKRGLTNIRLTRCEAAFFFRDYVPDHSVHAFHLLYPDPWPKKRHHKRRLIRQDFLADLRRVLTPGAEINIATDHPEYFDWMVEHFAAWKGTFVMEKKVLSSETDRKRFEGRTNYEIKYLREGRTIHLLTGYRTSF